MKGKKVMITGGAGFIGSNLAHACLTREAEVSLYDNLDPNSGGNLQNINDIKKDVRLYQEDICNKEALARVVRGQDIIFHCAALTSHGHSMQDPTANVRVNLNGTLQLLETIKHYNPGTRLVHLGSTTQLGRLHYTPADELHPEFPLDVYSANKSASEKYVLLYSKHLGIRATVARLPNTYGPRACIRSAAFTFNNFFVGQALQGAEIRIFGDGNQKRNVLYVSDAVEGLITLAENDNTTGETYHVTSDDHYSVREIAETTIAVFGRGSCQAVPWPDDRKVMDFGDAILSNRKVKEATDWRPRTGFRDGLELTREFYGKRLAFYLP